MRSVADGDVSLFLVLTAACSLFSMIGLMQLHRIVNRDLYSFGLQFSYAWAVPYWNIMNFVFAMGWLTIIAAIAFQSYLIMQKRKTIILQSTDTEKQSPQAEADQIENLEERESELAEEPKSAPDESKEPRVLIRAPQEET